MSVTERNKQKVRLFVEAVLNEGRLELIEQLVAADFVGHLTGVSSPVIGAAEVQRLVSSTRCIYPDLYVKIEEQIAEDDQVVVRWRATVLSVGTDSTSGRGADYAGMSIVRFLAGKQVDSRTEYATVASDRIREVANDPRKRSRP
jgi:predicted SnoaL-like aldol condensation-catalyzing enzyme